MDKLNAMFSPEAFSKAFNKVQPTAAKDDRTFNKTKVVVSTGVSDDPVVNEVLEAAKSEASRGDNVATHVTFEDEDLEISIYTDRPLFDEQVARLSTDQ